MLKVVNATDEIAAARLIEFFSDNSLWQRSLWSVGVELGIAELLEVCAAVQTGTLSEGALRNLASSCIRTAGKDPVLSPREKSILNEYLKNPLRLEGIGFFAIKQLGERINRDYLCRWASEFRAASPQHPELAARSIASYLMDKGLSSPFLYKWFSAKLHADAVEITLAELCEEAHTKLAIKAPTDFEVLIAFKHAPRSASGYPANWVNAADLSLWLRNNGFNSSGVRPSGGLILSIQSRDVYATADLATSVLDRYVARASIGTGKTLEPWPCIWVKGHAEPFSLQAKRRGVRVKALYREDQVFANPKNSNVDAAIELLAHLENSSPGAAIAGGWAAIEALLGEPGDRASAADNLSALVACSIPRAELTALSYVAEKHWVAYAPSFRSCTANRDRAALMAQLITSGTQVTLPRATDQAAVRRMQVLLRDPRPNLRELQLSVSDAFHRLYRQRNLILHGGIVDSVALIASLRTAAKLAGAGMDRVAHGVYVQGLQPLELAARARLALTLVASGDSSACVDLLGA